MARKILMCDDDEGILEVSKAVLESSGYYKVKTLTSFDNFFNILKVEKPDLLLIDLWMPKISGDEIIKKLKRNKETSTIPIIIISASRDICQISKESEADNYLCKPFDLDELLSVVNKTLSV
ncbi:response regulator [Candidatus Microgenomates bacterium]|jgi:DNA-binding response OmpR family regulator|nr:MAG: response regulator [Candidatus Microgenomates bacterium]